MMLDGRVPEARRNQRLAEEAQPVVASVHSEECQSLLSSLAISRNPGSRLLLCWKQPTVIGETPAVRLLALNFVASGIP